MRAAQEQEFLAFAEAAMPRLRRLALGTVREPHRADDLLQTTMEKLYISWPKVARAERPLAYARQVLVRTHIDQARRHWWQREVTTHETHVLDTVDDPMSGAAAGIDLRDALSRLADRQRLCVVLRHLEGLSVAETATLMRCSEGTVKSTTSDALRLLRADLVDEGPTARTEGEQS